MRAASARYSRRLSSASTRSRASSAGICAACAPLPCMAFSPIAMPIPARRAQRAGLGQVHALQPAFACRPFVRFHYKAKRLLARAAAHLARRLERIFHVVRIRPIQRLGIGVPPVWMRRALSGFSAMPYAPPRASALCSSISLKSPPRCRGAAAGLSVQSSSSSPDT